MALLFYLFSFVIACSLPLPLPRALALSFVLFRLRGGPGVFVGPSGLVQVVRRWARGGALDRVLEPRLDVSRVRGPDLDPRRDPGAPAREAAARARRRQSRVRREDVQRLHLAQERLGAYGPGMSHTARG